jgi:vitamin B12 transporter
MSRIRLVAIAALVASRSSHVAGQQAADTVRDTVRIAPVVVTATRLPLGLERVPASVTILDGAALRAQGLTLVADALRSAPAMTVVQSGSYGAQTSLFTRGGQNNYTKVLVDGVPLNDPGGALDLGTLTLDDVDRIEIVRGPASVLYGSDAVAGVVQILTRRGSGARHLSADLRGGTYDTYDLGLDADGHFGATSFSVGGGHHASGGIYRFNSSYRNDVGYASIGPALWNSGHARVFARYADVTAHYPTDFTGAPVDPNAFRTERRTLIGADLGQRWSLVDATLALASNLADGAVVDPPNDASGTLSEVRSHTLRQSADLRLSVPVMTLGSLSLGGALERQHQASPNAERRTAAGYVELLRALGSTTATLGARLDHSSAYGDFGTFRASVGRQLPSHFRLRGTIGTAFREPSFVESFDTPFSVANPSLRPERTTSWEVGVERRIGSAGATVGATYFHQRFVDLIDYRYAPPSSSTYENVARARAAGSEIELRIPKWGRVHADASYTWLDTRVLQSGFDPTPLATLRAGGPLLRRPKHSASAGIGGPTLAGGSADIRATYVGRREDRLFHGAPTFDTQAVTLSPYTKVDLSLAQPLATSSSPLHALSLTLRIDNALATHYESVAGYATPGRVILAGARGQF